MSFLITVGVLPQGRAIRSPGAQTYGNPWKAKIARVENQGQPQESQQKPEENYGKPKIARDPRIRLSDLIRALAL